MALKKEIELDNGIITNYHRITSINKITNVETIVELSCYISKEKRNEELEAKETGKETNIFINTLYISIPYDSEQTITDIYNYLKTLDTFKGATNI